MITNPRKKENLQNLALFLEHAEILAKLAQKYPEYESRLTEHMKLVENYKNRTKLMQ